MKTVEIVRQIVEGISAQITFTEVTDTGTACRYLTCNTSYAMVGRNIDLGAGPVEITAFKLNEWIEVDNTGFCTITDTGILDYNVQFYYGTVINTNNELTGIQDTDDKTPMIYLLEPFVDKVFHNGGVLDRTSRTNLFFLSWSNYQDWQTNDHHKFVLDPMENLIAAFIESAKNNRYVDHILEYEQTSRVNFGVYSARKNEKVQGALTREFNDQLSGVEIQVTIPTKRNFNNCC